MTTLRSTPNESCGRRGGTGGRAWRPVVLGRSGVLPSGPATEPFDDPASLLGGGRLALSVTDAAALLGISRGLAYELVARGELPSIRLGRRLVVPKMALLEMLGLRPRREA
jgi:excisionase family DNA binding protein